MSSGSSGGGSSTQYVTQQIPQYEEDFSQANQNIAASLGSADYQPYQGQLQANLNPLQTQALYGVTGAGESYKAPMAQALQTTNQAGRFITQYNNLNDQAGPSASNNPVAMGQSYMPGLMNGANNAVAMGNQVAPGLMANAISAGNDTGSLQDAGALETNGMTLGNRGAQNIALDPSNAATVQSYMSPYVQAALDPQLQQINLQFGKQAQDLASTATSAGAFGDARLGVSQSLNNYYNNLASSGVEAQGYNTAFNNAMNTIGNQQQLGVQEMAGSNSAFNSAGGMRQGEQGLQLQGTSLANQILTGQQANQLSATGLQNSVLTGQQNIGLGQMSAAQAEQRNALAASQSMIDRGKALSDIASSTQANALNSMNAQWAAGQKWNDYQQQTDNLAYQQWMDQQNWAGQKLNQRESALSNSPYSMQTAVQLPGASANATNLGAFASLLGMSGASSGWGQSTVPQPIK